MVDSQLRRLSSQAVLATMSKVPRHRFVPPAGFAYTDEQTISSPHLIMTELIEQYDALCSGDRHGFRLSHVLAERAARLTRLRSPRAGPQCRQPARELVTPCARSARSWPERAP